MTPRPLNPLEQAILDSCSSWTHAEDLAFDLELIGDIDAVKQAVHQLAREGLLDLQLRASADGSRALTDHYETRAQTSPIPPRLTLVQGHQ